TEKSRSLIVSSGGALLSSLASSVPGTKLSITPGMAKEHLYADLLDGRRFDFCLCGIAFDHLFQVRSILNDIYPLLEPNGRIVIFFQNTDRVPLERHAAKLAEGLFPIIGSSRVTFSGSLPGNLGSRWLAFALSRFNAATVKGLMQLAVTYGI